MKRIFPLIFFLFFINNLNSQIIDKRTGVLIYHKVDEDAFPISWQTNEIAAKGVSLDTKEIERSVIDIKNALNKYPKEVITRNLKKVYILKSIEFYGQEYGGTNSTDVVYIANNGVLLGYSDFYLEKTFHHEFSSILLRNYPNYIKSEKWMNLNKMRYGNGGVQALKESEDSQEIDSLLNIKGFLYEYAASDFENDFNSFAENLFNPSEKFYQTVKEYPILMNKLELILEFYQSLNNTFTKQYFIELNKKNK